MDGAKYDYVVPSDDHGVLKTILLDNYLRKPAEVTWDADRSKNMEIKSRDPNDVQFGEQYEAFF